MNDETGEEGWARTSEKELNPFPAVGIISSLFRTEKSFIMPINYIFFISSSFDKHLRKFHILLL